MSGGQMENSPKPSVLFIIIFAQFAGTSLWFAGNAVLPSLALAWELPPNILTSVTSAVQLGFISGTFLFAFLGISDRFQARKLFFLAALLGGTTNVLILVLPASLHILLMSRFAVGLCLAGIYPIGMKIAAEWFGNKLGFALGLLVAALVAGTAFPHLLAHLGADFDWEIILVSVSALAILGGFIVFFGLGDGPYKHPPRVFKWKELSSIFSSKDFRGAAYGYFGHMWELYTFWAFVPVLLAAYNSSSGTSLPVSLWSFFIIMSGALACALGGRWSIRWRSRKVALSFLSSSALFCFCAPVLFQLPPFMFLLYLMLWGFVVAGDSPQFSSLNAQTAPSGTIGTALTFTVAVGFFITVPSIWLLGMLSENIPAPYYLPVLGLGPLLGIFFAKKIRPQL